MRASGMSSFEWMELQALTNDIELSRSRLVEARSRGDRGRARALGEEIEKAEKSRLQLLAHLSTNIARSPEPAPPPKVRDGAVSQPVSPPVAEALQDEPSAEQPLPEPVDQIIASGAISPASAPKAESGKGDIIVWDQLTPGDIERAKNELGARRAEVQARHVEEQKGLDAEQSQLEALELAIETFLKKMNQPSSVSTVVDLRQQGND
jgi:hypothetical protein